MTAWTGLIVFMAIVAECALVCVGIEYGPEHQPVSDEKFRTMTILVGIAAILVDIYNLCGNKKHE